MVNGRLKRSTRKFIVDFVPMSSDFYTCLSNDWKYILNSLQLRNFCSSNFIPAISANFRIATKSVNGNLELRICSVIIWPFVLLLFRIIPIRLLRSATVAEFPALSPLVSLSVISCTIGSLSTDRNASRNSVCPSSAPLTDMSVPPSAFFSQRIVMLDSFINIVFRNKLWTL